MTVRIEPATLPALQHIMRRLRAIDRAELTATALSDDLDNLPALITRFCVTAFVAIDEQPIAAWGLMPMWPGVGTAWAFGTDDWDQALLAMTRHVRRFMLPMLMRQGYHRIEARGLAQRPDTERWLKVFGARPEVVLRCFGKSGEDFVLYRWLSHERRQTKSVALSADQVAVGHA